MRRLSAIHAVLAAHATCSAANLVLALVWSSWVLALVGAGWALVAALLSASRDDGDRETGAVGSIGARTDDLVPLPDP